MGDSSSRPPGREGLSSVQPRSPLRGFFCPAIGIEEKALQHRASAIPEPSTAHAPCSLRLMIQLAERRAAPPQRDLRMRRKPAELKRRGPINGLAARGMRQDRSEFLNKREAAIANELEGYDRLSRAARAGASVPPKAADAPVPTGCIRCPDCGNVMKSDCLGRHKARSCPASAHAKRKASR